MFWVLTILSVALGLQAIEMLQLRRALAPTGVWSWDLVRRDFAFFPSWIRRGLDLVMGSPNFICLPLLQLALAVLLPIRPAPFVVWALLAIVMLGAWRWRGNFNGGSDAMVTALLTGLCLGTLFRDRAVGISATLWYISVQLCFSYFVSGIVKLRQREWRDGSALGTFLNGSSYDVPESLRALAKQRGFTRVCSWSVILLECSFPLALVGPHACVVYIGLGLGFHLANVYAFGLNRFLWAWAAAYPALYLCAR